jgi:hypothetical protein
MPVVGWREWVALPELGVERIKAKVDTGARSSALHAMGFRARDHRVGEILRFEIHPIQRSGRCSVTVEAEVIDLRWVRSSSGASTLRPVIRSPVRIGEQEFPIELTLVRRDVMGFRMLLGRQAVRRRFLIDPARSFLAGERSAVLRPKSKKVSP